MPLRVLFFSHCHTLKGGAARCLLALLRTLPRDAFEPFVVVPRWGDVSRACENISIPCHECPPVWWVTDSGLDAWLYGMNRLPDAVGAVRDIIRREKIDVVHSNTAVAPAGAIAAALEGKPHVWHVREFVARPESGLDAGPLPIELLAGAMRSLSCRVVCVSHAISQAYFPGSPDAKLTVLHDGVDASAFYACSPGNDPVVLAIGATEAKGLSDLVKAAHILRTRGRTVRFEVLGTVEPPEYRKAIIRRLHEAGLTSIFRLAGYRDDVASCMTRARVFASPSHTEAMPGCVLQAMAAGLPVAATDAGGTREAVEHGATGLLSPVRSPEALADNIQSLLDGPDTAERMGQAGRARVCAGFDLERVNRDIGDVLLEARSAEPATAAAPLCELILRDVASAGPRTLLGKKWKLLRAFLR